VPLIEIILPVLLLLAGVAVALVALIRTRNAGTWVAGMVAFLLITAGAGWGGIKLGGEMAGQETIYTVPVSANRHPSEPTEIQVEAGDWLIFSSLDNDALWTCSTSHLNDPEEPDFTTADGIPGFQDPDGVFPPANLCELVGRIEGGPMFRVGSHERIVARQSGILYLGVNDDPQGYGDNSGSITMEVRVQR